MTLRKSVRKGAGKVPALVVVIAGSVAFAAGMAVAPSPVPSDLASAMPAEKMPVSTVKFKDSTTVQVTLGLTEPRKLIAGMSGTVTASSCISGHAVASGTSTFEVDGTPLINLATATPLWRDLNAGDVGEDVRSLQTELTRLGYQTPVTGVLEEATLGSYNRLAAMLGSMGDGHRVPREHITWLPLAKQTIQKCTALPGVRVVDGDGLADLPAQITIARLGTSPESRTPGTRVLTIDGVQFNVAAEGIITDPTALAELAGLASYAAAQASATPGTLTGKYELATPEDVLAVPPGALFGVEGTKACISSRDVVHPVTIVGSQLGVSYLTGASIGQLSEVDLDPGPEDLCE